MTDALPIVRRRYLPDDFRRDAAGQRVVATVHMEAEWDVADEVAETRWLAALRKEHGLPTVAVGHARFATPSRSSAPRAACPPATSRWTASASATSRLAVTDQR